MHTNKKGQRKARLKSYAKSKISNTSNYYYQALARQLTCAILQNTRGIVTTICSSVADSNNCRPIGVVWNRKVTRNNASNSIVITTLVPEPNLSLMVRRYIQRELKNRIKSILGELVSRDAMCFHHRSWCRLPPIVGHWPMDGYLIRRKRLNLECSGWIDRQVISGEVILKRND